MFNVTVYVMDMSDNIAADSLIVAVGEPGLESMRMMLIGLGGVAVVVIIAGILIKRKT